MLWPKKNSYKEFVNEKIPAARKFPLPPPPHNVSTGPFLKRKSYAVVRWRGEASPPAYLMDCISSFCPMKGNLGRSAAKKYTKSSIFLGSP